MLVHLHIAALAALAASSAWAKQAEEKWYNPNGVNPELKKLTKIVLFMQENRAFDHYFGTMPGVRGFQDPNVMVSNNTGLDQSLGTTASIFRPKRATTLPRSFL